MPSPHSWSFAHDTGSAPVVSDELPADDSTSVSPVPVDVLEPGPSPALSPDSPDSATEDVGLNVAEVVVDPDEVPGEESPAAASVSGSPELEESHEKPSLTNSHPLQTASVNHEARMEMAMKMSWARWRSLRFMLWPRGVDGLRLRGVPIVRRTMFDSSSSSFRSDPPQHAADAQPKTPPNQRVVRLGDLRSDQPQHAADAQPKTIKRRRSSVRRDAGNRVYERHELGDSAADLVPLLLL